MAEEPVDSNSGGEPAESGKGLWSSLLSLLGLGGGGSGAAAAGTIAGEGALGGGGLGAGLGGGLLATKAGLVGLIAAGTAVAGGVGVATYKMFGPQSLGTANSYSSLFPQRTQSQAAQAPATGGGAGVAGAGANQGSLAEFQQANAVAAAKPAALPAGYLSPGAQASAASAGSLADAASANASFIPSLSGGAKSVGGAGAPQSSASPGGTAVAAPAASGQGGGVGAQAVLGNQAGAMSPAGAAGAGGMRAFGGGVGGGDGGALAYQQGMHELSENRGGTSSQGAGTTYDGAAGGGGGTQLTGGGSGGGGPSAGSPSSGGSSNPSFSNTNPWRGGEAVVPPANNPTAASPYQTAIEMAAGMIAGALGLILYARKLMKVPTPETAVTARMALLAAAVLGVVIMGIGADIGAGLQSGLHYGQPLQGALFIFSGFTIAIAAAKARSSILKDAKPTPAGTARLKASWVKGGASSTTAALIAGAAGAIAAMFLPTQSTCPARGSCPDIFPQSSIGTNPSPISNLMGGSGGGPTP